MATDIGELQVLISAQSDKFNSEISKVQKTIGGLSSKISNGFSGASVAAVAAGNVIAKAFTTAMGAISNSMDGAIKRLDTINNFPNVMSNLGIGSEDAQAAINKLSEKLDGLPTTLDDAALAVQRFTSANGNVKASTDMFLALNNAILAGGAPMEAQATALEQLSQAYAKGKPDMQEWRSLLTAMPAQLNQVAMAMGYASSTDLGEALRSGAVSMNDFMATITRLNTQGVAGFANFETQARNATGGVATSITNMQTAVKKAVASVLNEIGRANIASFINGVASVIKTVGNYIAAFIRLVKQAVAWVQALFGEGGGGSTKELVKETGTASSNMGEIASGAGDTAGNLGNANKEAKKLQKQLAGFDEMNVLNDKDSGSGSGGSGGGGGAGGGGGISVPDYEWDSFEKTGDIIDSLADKIKKLFKDIFGDINFEPLFKSLRTFVNGSKKAFSGLLTIADGFVKNFLQPVTKFAIENALPRYIESVGKFLGNIDFSKIKKATDTTFKKLGDIMITIMDAFARLTEFIEPIAEWFMNFVVPPALEIVAAIVGAIASFIQGLWDTLRGLIDWIQPSIQGLMDSLSPLLDMIADLFEWISKNEVVMGAFRAAGQLVAGIIGGPLAIAIKLVCGILETLFKIIENVVKIFKDAFKKITDIWSNGPDFFSNIWETIKTIFSVVPKVIGAFFEGAWTAISKVFGGIGGWFGDRFNDIKNAMSGVKSFFKNIFQEAWNAITGIFGGIGKWFGDRFNDVKNAMSGVKTFFKDTFTNAYNGIKSTFGNVGSWFGDRFKDIKNAFSGAYSKFKEVGNNIWNGLKSGIGDVANNMKNMFSGAVDSVKNFLGIHSPSRLFMKIGDYVSQGFANGIEDGSTDIESAMSKITSIATEAMSGYDFSLASIAQSLTQPELSAFRGELELDQKNEPVRVTVNIGEDNLVDRIVNAINNDSFMKNSSVINI